MSARLVSLALGTAGLMISAPAYAQHEGHAMPAQTEPASSEDPHAGHVMPAPPPEAAPPTDPHAGHSMAEPAIPEPQTVDAHAGHAMEPSEGDHEDQNADPHAGHTMSPGSSAGTLTREPEGTDLPAGSGSPPPLPSEAAADAVYGPAAMAMGRHHLQEFHGGQKLYQVMFNVAEAQFRDGRDGFKWDASAWYGGDIDRLWIKSEGEGEFGGPVEQAEVQLLYSHAIDPYFNVQAGVRYDIEPNPSRAYAVLAIEGLAPSFFDVEAALFLSHEGELMARAEASYDQRITQRLILQPNLEVNFSAQDVPELNLGSGLSDAEAGLRLRYDIRREFAPYVGVEYRRTFGDTRELREAADEDTGGWSFVTGIRWWF